MYIYIHECIYIYTYIAICVLMLIRRTDPFSNWVNGGSYFCSWAGTNLKIESSPTVTFVAAPSCADCTQAYADDDAGAALTNSNVDDDDDNSVYTCANCTLASAQVTTG